MLQDLFLDEPSHGAAAGGVALSPRFSLPPLFVASSSLSGLTRPEESRLSAHARERPEAPAEATAAAAAAEDPTHRSQAALAAAGAILAAASPKRPGGGRGGAARTRRGAGQPWLRPAREVCFPATLVPGRGVSFAALALLGALIPNPRTFLCFVILSLHSGLVPMSITECSFHILLVFHFSKFAAQTACFAPYFSFLYIFASISSPFLRYAAPPSPPSAKI